MHIYLSVSNKGQLYNYEITAEGKAFRFRLRSAPKGATYTPKRFTVRQGKRWVVTPKLRSTFREGVLETLGKIPRR